MKFDSGWQGDDGRRVDPRRQLALANGLLQYLRRALGRLPSSNRLENALKFIAKHGQDGRQIQSRDRQVLDGIIAADATLRSASLAFAALRLGGEPIQSSLLTADWLSCFLSGADQASTDANSSARDTEFEVVTAARMFLGGLVVRPAEPDLWIRSGGRDIALAIKRLSSTSMNALNRRIRDACRQIKKSGGRGYLVLGLDSWTAGMNASPRSPEFGQDFNARVRAAHEAIRTHDGKLEVLGVMIFADTSWWIFDDPRAGGVPALQTVSGFQAFTFAESQADVEEMKALFENWQAKFGWNLDRIFPSDPENP